MKCEVVSCNNYYANKPLKMSFFSFPSDIKVPKVGIKNYILIF